MQNLAGHTPINVILQSSLQSYPFFQNTGLSIAGTWGITWSPTIPLALNETIKITLHAFIWRI